MKPCPLCQSPDVHNERILNNYPLLACRRCAFVFADIGTDEIETINSSLDETFAASFAEQHQSAFEAVFFQGLARRYTQLLGPGRVLDVGCGNGLLLSYFRELGWDCIGVDLSPWSREYAQRYDFEFRLGRLEDQGLSPGTFDLMTSTSTLEHIADPVPHLAAMLAAVRPGGRIFFSGIPNYHALALRWGVADFGANTPPHHPNFFTPASLAGLFAAYPDAIAAFDIHTYGISGANRAYSRLKRLWSKRHSMSDETDRPAASAPPAVLVPTDRPAVNIGHRVGAHVYRLAGRPLSIGSKIEAEIVRK